MRRVIFVSEPENGNAFAYLVDRHVGMRVGLGMSEQLIMDAVWNERGFDESKARKTPFPWTPEQVEMLRQLTDDGLTCSRIAKELGTSRNSIIGKQHRLGVRSKSADHRPSPKRKRKPARIQLYPDRQRKKYQRKPPMIFDNYQPQTVDVVPLNLTIFELTATSCRWPYGDVPNMKFCGHPVAGELPYCACHCRIAYRVPERMREAA